ncbi:hypothetical protein ACQY0O_007839 [Thecaphora frezii]
MRFSVFFAICVLLAALGTALAQQPSASASATASASASANATATTNGTASATPTASGNTTVSGNLTTSGNSTSSNITSTSTTPTTFPTASAITSGPFAGTAVAPAPGIGGSGATGPDDTHIVNSAKALAPFLGLVGATAAALGAGVWLLF